MARRSSEISSLEWHPSDEFTLGAEDELLLVDENAELLGQAAAPVLDALRERATTGNVKGEVFADEVELETPVCADAEQVYDALKELRRTVTDEGVRMLAAGVHPTAAFGAAALTTSPRYDRLGHEFAGLLRTPTAAFQVHVGLPDPASALTVYRTLRNRLSVFRALAAGSPYWHGRDSGLACVRPAILRSYPRTTMPPALPSWEAYEEAIAVARWAHEVPDYSYVCWELRPQPRLGTIEVRVMDAQSSLDAPPGWPPSCRAWPATRSSLQTLTISRTRSSSPTTSERAATASTRRSSTPRAPADPYARWRRALSTMPASSWHPTAWTDRSTPCTPSSPTRRSTRASATCTPRRACRHCSRIS
ncbi:carboxylate-amine ligase [Mumia quercus]|uniref:carboxylate-amine ligase n=1 Tax=Mumia quercus TaxID=2976125 RepID=UPI0021D3D787|nr:glutamate-cysteine ligase family protein [Mumia quercus]